MNGEKNKGPSKTELEITLLGPGYGESVVIHIGNDQWVVIDSCVDVSSKACAPLSYLQRIGVDPINVVLIIATHWHDDHVRKLSTLFEACTNAKFCCSSALTSSEFLAYVTSFEQDCNIKLGSGVSELHNILKILRNRLGASPPIHALCNRRILFKPEEELGNPYPCEIWSLSPSDGEKDRFLQKLKDVIPINGESRYRANIEPNNLSVVIQIIIGNEKILLGADLEETTDPFRGWSVIVDTEGRPTDKSTIFKIPHHGSPNAHADCIWSELLEEKPLAILTPFHRGKTKLPSPSDIERILSLTPRAYSTASINQGKLKKREPLVEKEIKRTVGKLRSIAVNTGTIRLRKDTSISNTDWHMELFDGACHLSEIHQH